MNTVFLENKTAKKLYQCVKDLPIIDYHCHLVPKEIAEDAPFKSIYELWLKYDHYKWRLMRAAGIDEAYITGDKPEKEKFRAYIAALQFSANHPLYHWSKKELETVFRITLPLRKENADRIYEEANAYIQKTGMKPSDLFRLFRVETLCTTDDPADSLKYHEAIAASTLPVTVIPSFRTDNLLRVFLPNYRAYIEKLSMAAATPITDLDSLFAALKIRLDDFVKHGMIFSDMGIPEFPSRIAEKHEATETFRKLLAGETVTEAEADGFVGFMTVSLAGLYKEKNLVMQLHMGVYRDSNSVYQEALGDNIGCDTANDVIPAKSLITVLDAINKTSGLPRTILYTLNEADVEKMASIAYAFPQVRVGAAWWFNDHKSGIENQLTKVSELGTLAAFPGMLTDSRSFLSYTRHDYFRRIVCSFLGRIVEDGSYEKADAETLAKMLSYENTKRYFS